MSYEDTYKKVAALEDYLLTERLSIVKFDNAFTLLLSLRKNYELDLDGKYAEASQFLGFLKTLVCKRERYMSNVTFDSVIKQLVGVHKEFLNANAKEVFKTREGQYLDEIGEQMKKHPHLTTNHRLNYLFRVKQSLFKEQEQMENSKEK